MIIGQPQEEFIGPFASWLDLKRDFGAVGDGVADDTAAWQAALDTLRTRQKSCVLYPPDGTYRITQTLSSMRRPEPLGHTDNMVSIIGQDPSKVVIKWDGPPGGTMLEWDGWYSKLSRMTFDGSGTALYGLMLGPSFSTYNELSDLVFKGMQVGISMGQPVGAGAGQAECEVLRCNFDGCTLAGVQTDNWNSLDCWVWYSAFRNCGTGIRNIMGGFHVWESLFVGSTVADISSASNMVFTVANNATFGGQRFMDFRLGSPLSITGNYVNSVGDWALLLRNGPYLVVDNTFDLQATTRSCVGNVAQTFVGNVYNHDQSVLVGHSTGVTPPPNYFRSIEEAVFPAVVVLNPGQNLPGAPWHNPNRQIFDVGSGLPLQTAINQAVLSHGAVHLPMGKYNVSQTLTIPAGANIILCGDGASEIATCLVWTGLANEPVLSITGPAKVVVRDLNINAGLGQALLITVPDSETTSIFADQLNVTGPLDQSHGHTACVQVSGFSQSSIQLRCLQGAGNAGSWVEVVGNDSTNPNPVCLFNGASGPADVQYDVSNGGSLVVRGVYHEAAGVSPSAVRLDGTGTLSIDGTKFDYATVAGHATFQTDGFTGQLTLAACLMVPVNPSSPPCSFDIAESANVLCTNSFFQGGATGIAQVWTDGGSLSGGLMGCGLSDEDTVSDAGILSHLAPLRQTNGPHPIAINPNTLTTVVSLYRIAASGQSGNIVEILAA